MTNLPSYDAEIKVGDIVRPRGGGRFRGKGPKTAIVTAVRLYMCPIEGPEWLAETTAGDGFTFGLERVNK